VRPIDGRYIAGVCAALGRATNTDPVLWRVALPVLIVVGGLGALLYLVGWLLIPSEGDSASPFEALLGRGHSSTTRELALVLSIVVVFVAIGGFTGGPGGRLLLFAAVVAGVVLLVTSRDAQAGWSSRSASRPPWTPPPGSTPGGPAPGSMPGAPTPPGPTPPGPIQAPFAPYGPYATSAPYSTPRQAPEPCSPPPTMAPRPPKSTAARRAILSCVVLAVGLLGVLDAADAVSAPAPAYFALALATLGVGMIVAAFFGRVRGPIVLGVILVLGLLVSSAISGIPHRYEGHDYVFRPATVAQLNDRYDGDIGRMTLDLTGLDPAGLNAGAARAVTLHLNVGMLRVKLPPSLDVTVTSQVDVGSTKAFGREKGGIGAGVLEVSDTGPDGPGGGSLIIDASVNVGRVEVDR
jgi:phage shock protein PspC (stress-responsive transcriptional regulator)